MNMPQLFTTCVLCAIISITYSSTENFKSAICPLDAETCDICLQAGPLCAWCSDKAFKPRCNFYKNITDDGCVDIEYPKTTLDIEENRPVIDGVNDESIVQVQPQRIHLKIRPGDTKTINLTVRLANDYPVDLYYVMDLSNSMKNDLDKLKTLGTRLADEMRNITRKIRLGFGSFVDKPVSPFMSIEPKKLDDPCEKQCVPTFSFRNIHPLDNNTQAFSQRINETRISGNVDSAEGGLDALMQISVCKNETGWRDTGRRMVIYSSDDSFHIQGDAKLAGIVKPNDGGCYLHKDGNYTKALETDYPSIGHLNQVMTEKNIITIFAVTENQKELYGKLAEKITGSSVGALDEDSSNVIELIKDKYNEITRSVKLDHNETNTHNLTFKADCTSGYKESDKECKNLTLNSTVYFAIDVTAGSCSDNNKEMFYIKPVGIAEQLYVEVELICECNCSSKPLRNNLTCSADNGELVCGKCECDEGRFGENCQCDGNDEPKNVQQLCRQDNSSLACNGEGDCICGGCVCNHRNDPTEVISGKFCECDNFSCRKHDGLLCGGPERGTCECKQCICKAYKGDACECPIDRNLCKGSNKLECNNKGTCKCGVCECQPDYYGRFCESCPSCTDCENHEDCVKCRIFSPDNTSVCETCNTENEYKEIQKDVPSGSCVVEYNETCSIGIYEENDVVHYNLDCASPRSIFDPENIPFLILGISVAIVLVGLALIMIYRMYTFIFDRKEYQQFIKEQQNSLWNQAVNPIYKHANQTFQNPMFGK